MPDARRHWSLLTMLSNPAGLSNGASNAQSTIWETIVRRPARRIEEPLNRQYDRLALSARFPEHQLFL